MITASREGYVTTPRPLRILVTALLLPLTIGLAQPASAQQPPPDELEGKPIKRIEIEGLQTISEAFIRRSIKTREGQPFSRRQLQEDYRDLLITRKFLDVQITPRPEDGEVVILIELREKPEIRSVEIEGNKRFSDAELFREIPVVAGSPVDIYDVNRGLETIERKYKEAGFYYVDVSLDQRLLREENRVVYRVVEGPRVKVRRIEIKGAHSFPIPQLKAKIRSKTYIWIFRRGALDEEQADRDALELQRFYQQEGFLDARVGYRLEFDDVDRTDVKLIFIIEEGPRYRVAGFSFDGNSVFSNQRLVERLPLEPGDFLRDEVIQEAVKRIENAYGEIGFVDARITTDTSFTDQPGEAILNFRINEGGRYRFGRITVRGNTQTKDEVVRRELRFYPGEEYDTVETRDAERRLRETGLFSRATITPLPPEGAFREALVEVEEGRTVDFLIGFGVSTDSGAVGTLTINNRNFDLFDWPRTWGEFFRGQAFRGDAQRLRFSAEPGTEVSRFRIDFTEPYLFDRPLRYDNSLYLFQRDRDSYDEQRFGITASLSRRFPTGVFRGWAVEGAIRWEEVEIDDIRPLASNFILDDKGATHLTSVKATIVRDTTDSRLLPSEGYRISFAWEQVGALGGDHHFGRPTISAAAYKTIRTDALDRKSILAVRGDVGYIVGDAPVFERFYGGGFGSIRGFSFRGVTPRSGLFNDKIGGDFMVLAGGEYSFPLYSRTVRGVLFLDMGTVEEDFEITTWRAAVGFGFRVNVDFFGPVPIVLDFGFPIASDDQDDTQVFNFSFGTSF